MILVTIVFPSILAQLQVSETNTLTNNPHQFNNMDYTWVKFCRGQISDVWEIVCGYARVGYGFTAENVICIIDYRDKPLFQHLNEHEELAIPVVPWLRGGISDNYIFANCGILSPKIIMLIYRLIS